MGRKNRKSQGSGAARAVIESPESQVESLIRRRQLRDAVKRAKVAFGQDPTPAHRRLYERTLGLRVQELMRHGMPTVAREVVGQLLALGVTDEKLLEDLALLLPQLGMEAQAAELRSRLTSPESQASLKNRIADRAVVSPEDAPASMPEIRAAAERVRAAWTALDGGDEARCLQLLQEIPRASPLADWRLFVRGLAAFHRGDEAQAAANWDRLAPDRGAAQIARHLRSAAGASTGASAGAATEAGAGGAGRPQPDWSRLETRVFGEPVLARLDRLSKLVIDGDWRAALELIGPLSKSLRKIDRRLAERLTSALLSSFSTELVSQSLSTAERLASVFTRDAEPLAFDPHWNRMWALLWEVAQDDVQANRYWRLYLADVKQLTALPEETRRRVQAAVWRHLADRYFDAVNDEIDSSDDFDHRSGAVPGRLSSYSSGPRIHAALEAAEAAVKLGPEASEPHKQRIMLYELLEDTPGQLKALLEMLEQFPDEVVALSKATIILARQERFEEALALVERAGRLQPLDSKYSALYRTLQYRQVRSLAIHKKFDAARAMLEELADPEDSRQGKLEWGACQAAIELKAGKIEDAQDIIDAALEFLPEPTAFWLLLAAESIWCKLPAKVQMEYERLFATAAGKKTNAVTAMFVAGGISALLSERNEGNKRQESLLQTAIDYLGRCTRLKFELEVIERLVTTLEIADRQGDALYKLAARGVRLFPDSALLLKAECVGALRAKPESLHDFRYLDALERALQIAETPGSNYASLIPNIHELIRQFQALCPLGRMRKGDFSGFFSAFSRMMGESFPFDEEDEDDLPPPPRPRGGKRRKSK